MRASEWNGMTFRLEQRASSTRAFPGSTWARLKFLVVIVHFALAGVSLAARSSTLDWLPLSERRGNSDGVLFESLPADRTGIDFIFEWEPPDPYKWIFDNTVGGGVAIGDYDGDGRPDIYLLRPFIGSRLYRNLGGFRFEDVTASAGVADGGVWGMGATFADLDNDGDLDLYVCGYDSPNRLYENRGDGTFIERAEEAGLNFKGASVMMAFADYDRDGDLDGYLLTNRYIPATGQIIKAELTKRDGHLVIPDELSDLVGIMVKPDGREKVIKIGQRDYFYRNNGDGTFGDVTEEAGITGGDMGLGVVWWDYNHDGWPDIYVSNDFYGADKLYRNNGDGSFTDVIEGSVPHTPWFSMGADVADINNDGLLDFMASDMAATTHYKAKANMGEMDEQSWFLTSARPPQYMVNSVYLNSGTSRFFEVSRLYGVGNTDWTWSVKFADFDNDGWVDLFVTNGMTRNWFNSDMRARLYALGGLKTEEGGRLFLEAPPLAERNLAFRNLRGSHFQKVEESWGLGHLGVSFGAALGDLDGDGDLDLMVNNFEEPVSVYRNQSSTGNLLQIRLLGTTSNSYGIGSRIHVKSGGSTQVRYLTLARGFASSDNPTVHFGLGEEETVDQLTVEWPSGRRQTLTALAANRFYTIREPSGSAPDQKGEGDQEPFFERIAASPLLAHRETPYDDFADQRLLPNKMSQLGPGLAWGRIGEDGQEALYIGGASGQTGRILFAEQIDADHPEEVRSPFRKDALSEDMGALFFDAESDGDLDLYVVSGGVDRWAFDKALGDRLYLNEGNGSFVESDDALPRNSTSGSCVVGGDFDRDGDLDLFVGGRYIPRNYPLTPVSRLLRNKGGKFEDVTEELAPDLRNSGLVTGALWSDVDGDGWLDLLVTHEWGPVKLYRNVEGGALRDDTERTGLAERLGWWNGIVGGDLDHDGDIDYAVMNFGLNTKYHATLEQPTVLYYGDFGPYAGLRLVEAAYEDGQLFPVRGKSCSMEAMPHLSLNFDTFHKFASASLSRIYAPRDLRGAQRFEVNTLESGILLNDGSGSFTFAALPRIAQAAPGFGAVLAEIDGDGNPDLYMVQNFFGPQPETGRMDGGLSLLLRGEGDGTFEPVWPNRSGLVVSGDATALAAMDLNGDGWVDFAIATNDGPMHFFQNNGSERNRSFSVRLRSKKGNSSATGSRVIVELVDGSAQAAEIYAGSGYLSQSTDTLFFGLGESGEVSRVIVRWSDGEETIHRIKPGSARVELVQPYTTSDIK